MHGIENADSAGLTHFPAMFAHSGTRRGRINTVTSIGTAGPLHESTSVGSLMLAPIIVNVSYVAVRTLQCT